MEQDRVFSRAGEPYSSPFTRNDVLIDKIKSQLGVIYLLGKEITAAADANDYEAVQYLLERASEYVTPPTQKEIMLRLRGMGNQHLSAAIWCEDDVIDRAAEDDYEVTREEAASVIDMIDGDQDASLGITWDTIDYFLDELKGKKDRDELKRRKAGGDFEVEGMEGENDGDTGRDHRKEGERNNSDPRD